MKYILILIMMTFSNMALSFTCINSLNGNVFSGSNDDDIPVFIDSDILNGSKNIFANIGDYISCANDYGVGTDFMDVVGLSPLGDFSMNNIPVGAYIKGAEFYPNSDFGSGVGAMEMTELDQYVPLDVDVFIDTLSVPSKLMEIKVGDPIMVVKFHFHSTNDDASYYYNWRFVAANSAFVILGTCDINDIIIDFGDVKPSEITTIDNLASAIHFFDETITYNCDSTDYNNPDVYITYSAEVSSFDDRAMGLQGVNGLGVVISKGDQIIKPLDQEGFKTQILNGYGEDTIRLSLVKTNTYSENDLIPGEFTGSGTIVMHVQ